MWIQSDSRSVNPVCREREEENIPCQIGSPLHIIKRTQFFTRYTHTHTNIHIRHRINTCKTIDYMKRDTHKQPHISPPKRYARWHRVVLMIDILQWPNVILRYEKQQHLLRCVCVWVCVSVPVYVRERIQEQTNTYKQHTQTQHSIGTLGGHHYYHHHLSSSYVRCVCVCVPALTLSRTGLFLVLRSDFGVDVDALLALNLLSRLDSRYAVLKVLKSASSSSIVSS